MTDQRQALVFKLGAYARANLATATAAAIALLAYMLILTLRIPEQIGLTFGRDLDWLLLVSFLVIYLAYRLQGWKASIIAPGLSLAPFALALAGLWADDFPEYAAIGGLLPWSDASDYYHEARLLLEGFGFTAWGSRRPLFHGMLAVLLGLTQQNLYITLAILVLITSACCVLLAFEIRHSYGPAAGTLVLAILFLFYRYYIGTTMSENLGVAMGALGMAIIWRGAGQVSIKAFALGMLLLTLALNARAGAFLVLPALAIWSAWNFRNKARVSWSFLAAGFGAVILGFGLNLAVLRVVASSDNSMVFSNYAYVLYGLASGGQSWNFVYQEHPEVKQLPPIEASQRVYRLAFETIRANPTALLKGMFEAARSYFKPDEGGELSYIPDGYQLRGYLHGLLLLGLLYCIFHYKDRYPSLLLASMLGVIASTSLVPPKDTRYLRAYAATVPISAIVIAVGAARVLKIKQSSSKAETVSNQAAPGEGQQASLAQPLYAFGIGFIVLVTLGPIVLRIINPQPQQFAGPACPTALETVYTRLSQGSSITIVNDPAIRLSRSMLMKDRFLLHLHRSGVEVQGPLLEVLDVQRTPFTMINVLELNKGEYIWLITDSSLVVGKQGIVKICGKTVADSGLAPYGFFVVRSIEIASSP